MESDSALVRRVLAGETEAFRGLVERYQDAVFGVALSKTGSFADAEEIAQEAFLAAFDSLAKLKDPGRFGNWLYGIALNKARMQLRSAQRRKRTRERLARAGRDAAADESSAERELVRGAMERLTPANREAATLFYIDGYSVADISRFTRRPAGTIKRRLHDARRDLRKELATMVEKELKQSRPGRSFTERVLRKIHRVRVHLAGGEANSLLLTDGKQRSFMMVIGKGEAKALQPWLEGAGSADAMDAHTALVRMLDTFGAHVERLTVAELKSSVFHASLAVRVGKRTEQVDCRPSDGINLAVRARAPMYAHKDVADRCTMLGTGRKPLSPDQAWRKVVEGGPAFTKKLPFFENIAQVIDALEKNPEADQARKALQQAAPDFHCKPSMVKDVTDGMAQLRAWVDRCKGSRREGVATGLLGAIYLYPAKDPQRAIPYLQRAHKLAPKDDRIAFDLATAYARTRRADEAFAILKNDKLTVFGQKVRSLARNCGNFVNLWDDPRFERMFGKPEPRWKHGILEAQARVLHWTRLPARGRREPSEQWRTAMGLAGRYLPGEEHDGPFKAPAGDRALRKRVEQVLECGPVAPIVRVSWAPEQKKPRRSYLICEVAPKRVAVLSLRWEEAWMIGSVVGEPPRPMTAQTFAALARAARIKLDAAALLKRRRWGIEAALIARKGKRREVISIEGPAAVAVAFASNCPILITEALAEKLRLRGKRPPPAAWPSGRRIVVSKVRPRT